MFYSFNTIEQIARDMIAERTKEAAQDRLLKKARKANQKRGR